MRLGWLNFAAESLRVDNLYKPAQKYIILYYLGQNTRPLIGQEASRDGAKKP
jgi:hypothetical protein